MLGIELNRGNVKEGSGLTPMSSFDVERGGVLTLDLLVAEFRSRCGQMDLASACVLHPLNHLVLDFAVWVRGQMNEWRSGGVPDRRHQRGLRARGGQGGNINWMR